VVISLIGSGAGPNAQARPVRTVPYDVLRTEDQIAVATTGTVLYISNLNFSATGIQQAAMIVLRNASAGGQLIRVGLVPDFVGPKGILLPPPGTGNALENTFTLAPVSGQWVATADMAGAVMDILIRETSDN